ncbi:hypothetical protein CGMCC3_g5953 [Colletotrichum fructicola]|nr:uncharacterized protein CGMCC3_g5953 [Colletotrichum fructicola]KAE9578133.1 hypothetical protein CGMCC3_g5953 [Colletotrichum fructicola]
MTCRGRENATPKFQPDNHDDDDDETTTRMARLIGAEERPPAAMEGTLIRNLQDGGCGFRGRGLGDRLVQLSLSPGNQRARASSFETTLYYVCTLWRRMKT